MKKSAGVCLVLAVVVMFAVVVGQGARTVPRSTAGTMDGSFIFDVFGWGPYDFIAYGEATGTVTHLGLTKLYTEHQPDPSGDGTLINTSFTLVAANGDKLFGTYDGAKVTFVDMVGGAEPPWVFYYKGKATLVIEGGTGRFEGASGEIDATFRETIEVFDIYWLDYKCSVKWTLAGTIDY